MPFTDNIEVSQYLRRQEKVRPRVLVAAQDLPAGTLLRDIDMGWAILEESASAESLVIRSETAEATLRGAYLKRDVKNGATIADDDLIRAKEQGFIIAALAPGMRAVSVGVSQLSGVSGYISPGDRVDMLLTHTVTDQTADPVLNPRQFTETILRNIRLLAIEQTVNNSTGKPVLGQTATVEVSPEDAEKLALAANMGSLSLALRSVPSLDVAETESNTWTSDFAVSDSLVNMIVFGSKGEPELVRARRAQRGVGVGVSTPQRRIIRTAPPPPPPTQGTPPSGTGAGTDADSAESAGEAPPSLAAELPAARAAEAEEAPEVRVIRVYRATNMSTVQFAE